MSAENYDAQTKIAKNNRSLGILQVIHVNEQILDV